MLRKIVLLVLMGGALLLTPEVIKRTSKTRQSQVTDNLPVARVYNQYLYKRDLEHLDVASDSAEDKEAIIERYVQSWVSKQLLIAEAEAHSGYNKAEIESKILDYKNDLLVHSFVEKLVNAQVNGEVSDEEIASYYKSHQKDFVLQASFFRGKFVVVPKDAPNRARLPSLLTGETERRLAALKRYCLQFSTNYVLDETIWLPWEELIKTTSLNNTRNKTTLLSTRKLLQASDSTQRYYFKISEYRLVGQVSPLDLVSNQIADLIIYRRKIDLANKIKKDLLRRAKKNNNCVIYEH